MRIGKDWFFRRRVIIPLGLVFLLAISLGSLFSIQPKFLMHQLALSNPDVLFYVETDQKVLALTIDDAPDRSLTPAILELLEKYDVRVTFFIIGEKVPGNEDLIKRMKMAGHELGNHLVEDEASIMLSDEEFERDLLEVEKLIGPLGETKWCRPGSGWFSPDMVKTAHRFGYRLCLGSIYPFDNKLRNPELIRQAVMARIYPGAVLILHEGDPKRDYIIPLLDHLIPDLLSEGYQFLTVSELQAYETRPGPKLP